MTETAWVALAGIAATLAAGLVGPLIAERARRQSTRMEKLLDRRLQVHADMLRVAARAADNMSTWSATRLADLAESDPEELDRIVSHTRVAASTPVLKAFGAFNRTAHEFYRKLGPARAALAAARSKGQADSAEAIQRRMELADIADEARRRFDETGARIRVETARGDRRRRREPAE